MNKETACSDCAGQAPVPITNEQLKDDLIKRSKRLRVGLDDVLQDLKNYKRSLCEALEFGVMLDGPEAIANCQLSIRAAEDAIMRQGMVLKAIGTPTPYPNSYNPGNSTVEPTADGMRM